MKIKKEICEQCGGLGVERSETPRLNESYQFEGPKCKKCEGKGYLEIHPEKIKSYLLFPFSEERCICPACNNGKEHYDYTRPRVEYISQSESDNQIGSYLIKSCGRCGYKWTEECCDTIHL